MTLVAWQAEFETGISSVDIEHKEMVELLNQLYTELYHDPDDDAIGDFLGEVFANILAHFALEEKIMRERHTHTHTHLHEKETQQKHILEKKKY